VCSNGRQAGMRCSMVKGGEEEEKIPTLKQRQLAWQAGTEEG
jgi:hypothetical protein